MDTIISLAPKTALLALLILFIVIITEVVMFFKRKKPHNKKDEPDLKPLHFSKVKSEIESPPIPKQKSPAHHSYVSIIAVVIVIIGIIAGGFYILNNKSLLLLSEIPLRPSVIKSKTASNSAPEIVIYKIIGLNTWKEIPQKDLKELNTGEIIKIAVRTAKNPRSAVIYVNNQQYTASAENVTPNGEPYIDYIIPEGVVDYVIRIEVQ